jgi:VanZ family protein
LGQALTRARVQRAHKHSSFSGHVVVATPGSARCAFILRGCGPISEAGPDLDYAAARAPGTDRMPTFLTTAMSGQPRAVRCWRIVFVLLSCLVAYLALAPAPPRAADFGWDKLNHAAAFGVLGFSASLGFGRSALAALALLLYGALIEAVQGFIPTRSAEWADLLADGAGIALGVLLAKLAQAVARGARRVPAD